MTSTDAVEIIKSHMKSIDDQSIYLALEIAAQAITDEINGFVLHTPLAIGNILYDKKGGEWKVCKIVHLHNGCWYCQGINTKDAWLSNDFYSYDYEKKWFVSKKAHRETKMPHEK